MPLYMRRIWPIDVGRKYRPESINFHRPTDVDVSNDEKNVSSNNLINSKEECANRTLSNIIRQLADLGKKSHEIFGETDEYILDVIISNGINRFILSNCPRKILS
jgi:hypothetical protein